MERQRRKRGGGVGRTETILGRKFSWNNRINMKSSMNIISICLNHAMLWSFRPEVKNKSTGHWNQWGKRCLPKKSSPKPIRPTSLPKSNSCKSRTYTELITMNAKIISITYLPKPEIINYKIMPTLSANSTILDITAQKKWTKSSTSNSSTVATISWLMPNIKPR